uniref:Uncharacterized protein n=1 Tax=Strongyloides venezuelensis TaxID=75913 RepID=A0A0K0FPF7_STRVS
MSSKNIKRSGRLVSPPFSKEYADGSRETMTFTSYMDFVDVHDQLEFLAPPDNFITNCTVKSRLNHATVPLFQVSTQLIY